MAQKTASQQMGQAGIEYRQRLIDRMLRSVGRKGSDAVTLNPDVELQRWMQPTSDAATRAFQMGGTLADAEEANSLSFNHARQQQQILTQQLQQQGAGPDDIFKQVQQAGLTDDQIFQAHQKYAYELGKSNGGGDAAKEVSYHDRMSKKATDHRANRPLIADVTGQGA